MRLLALACGGCVMVAFGVAACGSDDGRQVTRTEDGGAGGGSGGSEPTDGGSRASRGGQPSLAGSGGESSGGVPTAGAGAGGVPNAGAAGEASGGVAGEAIGGIAGEATGGAAGEAPSGAGGEAGAGGAGPQLVAELGFEDGTLPANLNPGTAMLTPTQGYESLGFGTTFLRGPTGAVVTLTLSDLPPHGALSLDMLFAAIDSLDGTGSFPSGDFFKITLDGQTIFRESFANALESQVQSYDPPAEAVLARHADLGFSGKGAVFPNTNYSDSAYDFGKDPRFQGFPHTGSTATLTFTLEGEGVQDLDDESWAIDDVRVTVQ